MAGVALTPSSIFGTRELRRTTFVPRQEVALLGSASHNADSTSPSDIHRLAIVAKKRRSVAERFGRQPPPPMPKVDSSTDSPQFVIFIKTKNVSIWYPLTMVTGGTTAQMMVNVMKWDLGKQLYEGTLTRNMADVVYKDEKAIQLSAIKQYPMLKGASGYEYGYKLVDKENPRNSVSGSGVVKIPPKEEMKTVIDKAKDFFSNLTAPKESPPAVEADKK